jgi:hypothetical protein
MSHSHLCNAPQGTIVMLPTLPLGLAQHNYGADAFIFKPQRWLDAAQPPAGAAAAGPDASSPRNANTLPDPNSFLSGPRDWWVT